MNINLEGLTPSMCETKVTSEGDLAPYLFLTIVKTSIVIENIFSITLRITSKSFICIVIPPCCLARQHD